MNYINIIGQIAKIKVSLIGFIGCLFAWHTNKLDISYLIAPYLIYYLTLLVIAIFLIIFKKVENFNNYIKTNLVQSLELIAVINIVTLIFTIIVLSESTLNYNYPFLGCIYMVPYFFKSLFILYYTDLKN